MLRKVRKLRFFGWGGFPQAAWVFVPRPVGRQEEREEALAKVHSKAQQLQALKAEWTVLSEQTTEVREAGRVLMKIFMLQQGSLKDTFCPFQSWLFPPK